MLKKILIGLIAGTVTGLFGSGGGMVLVPAFTFILKLRRKRIESNISFLHTSYGVCKFYFLL